jgi:hypothetical protein
MEGIVGSAGQRTAADRSPGSAIKNACVRPFSLTNHAFPSRNAGA